MVGYCVTNGIGTIPVCAVETGGLCLFAFKMGITNVSVKDEGEFLLKMGGLTCSCFICIGLNPGDVLLKSGGQPGRRFPQTSPGVPDCLPLPVVHPGIYLYWMYRMTSFDRMTSFPMTNATKRCHPLRRCHPLSSFC